MLLFLARKMYVVESFSNWSRRWFRYIDIYIYDMGAHIRRTQFSPLTSNFFTSWFWARIHTFARSWFNDPQMSTPFDYIFRVLTIQEDITRYNTMTTNAAGVLNAPSGPGRKFLEHDEEGILLETSRSKPFLVAKKRVRAAIEDQHQGEAISKRRKLNSSKIAEDGNSSKIAEDGKLITFQQPRTWKCEVCFLGSFSGMCEACERRQLNCCMISEDGKLIKFQRPGTWKCEVCFASLNSVNSDLCEACTEPRPTKEDEHKNPELFPESKGSATGNIAPLGFLFLGPCGAEPREAAIADIVLYKAPLETSPVIRRRVRAKRPKKRASSISTRSAEVSTRSRTLLQRTGTRECESRKHGTN